MGNEGQSNRTGNMIGHGGGAITARNQVHIGSLIVLSVLILIVAVTFALTIKKKR